MNNLLYYFFIVIIVNIVIKLLIRFYGIFFTKVYLYDIYIERIVLLNDKAIDYIMFTNIKNALNNDKLIKLLLNVILQYLNYVYYNNNIKLSIVFFEYNPNNKLYRSISDGYLFELSKHLSVNDLYKNIKWNNKFNNSNNILVLIKAL
jgi:hypothetical protein